MNILSRLKKDPRFCWTCGNVLNEAMFKRGFHYCSKRCIDSGKVDTFSRTKRVRRQSKPQQLSNPDPKALNSATSGAIGELVAAAALMQHGYDVFRALSPASGADLIAVENDKIVARIEVRCGILNPKTNRASCNKMPRDVGRSDHYAIVINHKDVYFEPPLPKVPLPLSPKVPVRLNGENQDENLIVEINENEDRKKIDEFLESQREESPLIEREI